MRHKYHRWSQMVHGQTADHPPPKNVPGFKTLVACPDPNNPGRVIDLQWFNTIAPFRGHIDVMGHRPVVMATMEVEKFWSKSEGNFYQGYAIGAFDQTAVMGMVRALC